MKDVTKKTDDFEAAAQGSPEQVAEFDDHRRGFIGTVQHFLHVNPSLVPLIVLVAATLIFGLLLGSRFFSPFALTLILQQVQIVGIVAAAFGGLNLAREEEEGIVRVQDQRGLHSGRELQRQRLDVFAVACRAHFDFESRVKAEVQV